MDCAVCLNVYCLYVHSVIAMMSPEDSWVAKWQRIGKDVCLYLKLHLFHFCLTYKHRSLKVLKGFEFINPKK